MMYIVMTLRLPLLQILFCIKVRTTLMRLSMMAYPTYDQAMNDPPDRFHPSSLAGLVCQLFSCNCLTSGNIIKVLS